MSAWTFDEVGFRNTLGRIAELGRKSLQEVNRDQGRLFVQDASGFTPPFGKMPIKETQAAKRKIGEDAVERDIKRGFYPADEIKAASTYGPMTKRQESLQSGFKRAVRKKDIPLMETLLRNMRWRNAGVLLTVEPERHQSMRNSRGRVSKAASYVVLGGKRARISYTRKVQKNVGLAKAGWSKAYDALGGKVPGWLQKHSKAMGVFFEAIGDTPSVTVGNAVPHAQNSYERISQQAWANRMRNSQKQLEALERAARRKMRELKLT